MFERDDLDDCLIEMLPFGSFPMKPFPKVNLTASLMLRAAETVDDIYPCPEPASPIGRIYRVTFFDGSQREVIVFGAPHNHGFGNALFLKEGRMNNQLSHIHKLIIQGADEAVPDYLKDYLKHHEKKCPRPYDPIDISKTDSRLKDC
jgi:hypothetical protein